MTDPSPYSSPDRRKQPDRRSQPGDRRLWSDRYNAHSLWHRFRDFLRVWLWRGRYAWLVRLALLILVVQWGVMSVYFIPTRSMEPTLHGTENWFSRDRVAVNKLAFGPRIPFSHKRLFYTGHPKRWDIVLINLPGVPKNTPPLIKRVVGMPGEDVLVLNGRVMINGHDLEFPEFMVGKVFITEFIWVPKWQSGFKFLELARFVLEGDVSQLENSNVIFHKAPGEFKAASEEIMKHSEMLGEVDLSGLEGWGEEQVEVLIEKLDVDEMILLMVWVKASSIASVKNRPMYGTRSHGAQTTVPEGMYFLLGDNGPESFDSRYYGWVEESAFIGRAFATVYPLNRIQDLSGFTQRASGKAILFGLLAFFGLWELVPALWVFTWRMRSDVSLLGLKKGDCLLVHRWSLGLYVPGIKRWLLWRNALQAGDTTAYWIDAKRTDMGFGRVVEKTSNETYCVEALSNGDENTIEVPRRAMVGLPGRVWYPFGRRSAAK